TRRRLRLSGLFHLVERWFNFPVGHAPHSRARPDLFSANDSKPIPRSAAADYHAVRKIFVWPQSHDAADRAARPRAAQAESSSPVILASFWHSIAHRELQKTALGLLRILGLTISEFAEQHPDERLRVVTFFEGRKHQADPAEFLEQVKSCRRPRGSIA